jgi:hypothetical protein
VVLGFDDCASGDVEMVCPVGVMILAALSLPQPMVPAVNKQIMMYGNSCFIVSPFFGIAIVASAHLSPCIVPAMCNVCAVGH